MSPIFLVAWREYKQYVFSRGFLLFLFMTPLLIVGGVFVLSMLDKARPQRAYVVVDQTNQFAELIDAELEEQRLRETVNAWNTYLELAVDRAAVAPYYDISIDRVHIEDRRVRRPFRLNERISEAVHQRAFGFLGCPDRQACAHVENNHPQIVDPVRVIRVRMRVDDTV